MKRFLSVFILITATLPILSGAVEGRTLSGNELYKSCTATDDPTHYAFCAAYVMGYVEGRNWGTFVVLQQLDGGSSADEINQLGNLIVGHCVPVEADYSQLIDVVIKYLQYHPETRHESARTLIWLSFRDAFPCDGSK